MTSEDVTMFRKQLILIYSESDIYFCAACCLFVSLFLSEKTIFHACTEAFFDFFFMRETFQLLLVSFVSRCCLFVVGETQNVKSTSSFKSIMPFYDEGSKETTRFGMSEEIVRLREYEKNDRTVLYLRDCPNAKAKIDDAFLDDDDDDSKNTVIIQAVQLELAKGVDDETVSKIARKYATSCTRVNLNAAGSGDERVRQFGNLGLMSVSEYLENKLECLELFWNTKITSKGVLSVCRFCHENLKVLNLSGCVQLDDEGVREISKCRKLRYLDLTRVPKMTDASVALVVEGCRELEFLSLYANSQLTNKSFEKIDGLTNLKFFDACGFNKLTDVTLFKLPKTLRYANFSWCGSLRSEGICHVAENCRHLELLSVHGNRNITEKLIQSLQIGQKETKTLKVLDVKGCVNVKTNTLEALREFFHSLQSIKFHT